MNYYVTTSIPYVNGDPHIGFALELIAADVLARYARSQAKPVIFSTGADEHGLKIAEKAAELNLTPQALVDQMSSKFRDLDKLLDISNDRFIRTTDPAHVAEAQQIWQALKSDIYKADYQGWYDVRQEEFVPEAKADAARKQPDHPQAYRRVEEENYFFKLSKYTNKVLEAIESDDFKIVPSTRRNEILALLHEGLDDISISRPKDKLAWGIPVPGDESQVMYVWFEALMNYITVLGYPEGEDFKKFWPANVQLVGKDIVRFHAAIWPAMLMSLGLPLPKLLYVHGFITVEGEKMSKSIGNVIAPSEIVEKYGTDAMRYYFMRHIPAYDDGDFSWDSLEAAYNNELANELGNAVGRTVAMIERYQAGKVGDKPTIDYDASTYHAAIEDCRFDKALDEVWQQVRGLNQYIDDEKPWVLAKTNEADRLKSVLAYQVSSLLKIAELLVPFMPQTAAKIQEVFKNDTVQPLQVTLFPKNDDAK
ncbi:MAG TPA: methionine--tRNA ligase [Candidatus Binatia bacterium]|nr:methionine--tRNA ligase [Candidatus Binatia bacterium]